jgi:hypothetical protein
MKRRERRPSAALPPAILMFENVRKRTHSPSVQSRRLSETAPKVLDSPILCL